MDIDGRKSDSATSSDSFEHSQPDGASSRAPSGCAVFFTGLPASGKSTLAEALFDELTRVSPIPAVARLDGDALRRQISDDLTYSRGDREEHLRRVARRTADIVRAGGIAICSLIAPFDSARKDARREIQQAGRFVLVYVSTPLDVCERRDPKGLYAQARNGAITHFTGVSDPYEPPDDAELTIDTTRIAPHDAARLIREYLFTNGAPDLQVRGNVRA